MSSGDRPKRWRDPVIEAYRAGIDVTLIDENLKLSYEERFRKLMELQRFAEELRGARERAAK
jgi:ribulose 1,5-bisphosphate carboxylase large subunit-like protein